MWAPMVPCNAEVIRILKNVCRKLKNIGKKGSKKKEAHRVLVIREGETEVVENPNINHVPDAKEKEAHEVIVLREGETEVVQNPNINHAADAKKKEEHEVIVLREGETEVVENHNIDHVAEVKKKEAHEVIAIRDGETEVVENRNDDHVADAMNMQLQERLHLLKPEENTATPPGSSIQVSANNTSTEHSNKAEGKRPIEFKLDYSISEQGQRSEDLTPTLNCPFCMEAVPLKEIFCINPCKHFFCIHCMIQYLAVKTGENAIPIPCPAAPVCRNKSLDPATCQDILPADILNRWYEMSLKAEENIATPAGTNNAEGKWPVEFEDLIETLNCPICMEAVPLEEVFYINPCEHIFCKSCLIQYLTVKTEENAIPIPCPTPGCGNKSIDPVTCQDILPADTMSRWSLALYEMSIGIDKLYCPYKDCSAMLIDEGFVDCECPYCKRVLCAKCKVPWHNKMTCVEYGKLGEDEKGQEDLMLRNMAKDKRWQRCPKCKMYVEKTEGCTFIKCRCQYCFCYSCASPMKNADHYCKKCKR